MVLRRAITGLLLVISPAARAGGAGAPGDSTATQTGPDSTRVYPIPAIEVFGSYEDSLAPRSAASQGLVTSKQIALRPLLRTGDVLESVPGVLISQHSGEGKANQYYLRGFNLDHGTDFATSVAGVPVNMPTHAHGQGYTDLNFVIPELVSGIQYRKGTYSVEDGDFSSAGSANISYRNTLPDPVVSLTRRAGLRTRVRGCFATRWIGHVLGALELIRNDGPWVHPDISRSSMGWSATAAASEERGVSVTAIGYDSEWNSTDQIPERAVASGALSRFGAIDPTDGGQSYRYSLSTEYQDFGPTASPRRAPTSSRTISTCFRTSPTRSTTPLTATRSSSSTSASSPGSMSRASTYRGHPTARCAV